jgi:hypothetical protein
MPVVSDVAPCVLDVGRHGERWPVPTSTAPYIPPRIIARHAAIAGTPCGSSRGCSTSTRVAMAIPRRLKNHVRGVEPIAKGAEQDSRDALRGRPGWAIDVARSSDSRYWSLAVSKSSDHHEGDDNDPSAAARVLASSARHVSATQKSLSGRRSAAGGRASASTPAPRT